MRIPKGKLSFKNVNFEAERREAEDKVSELKKKNKELNEKYEEIIIKAREEAV